MTAQTNDNKFACSRFIVDEDGIGMGATHTTIPAAIASASSGDTIVVKPGVYTENFTMKPNVPIIAWSKNAGQTRIIGKITINSAGSYQIDGFDLRTNGDTCIDISNGTLYLYNSICFAVDANFMALSGSGKVNAFRCTGSILDTGLKMWTSSSSQGVNWRSSNLDNDGSSTTASDNSAGTCALVNSSISFPVSTSGSGNFNALQGSRIVTSSTNTTCCTFGSGTNTLSFSYFESGSAAAISNAAAVQADNIVVNSSNGTAAITGAGSINVCGIHFKNSGYINNVTTQTERNSQFGGITFDGGTNVLSQYEEGTFTPDIGGSSTRGTSTVSIAVGRYTRIGNRVFYNLRVQWTNITGAAGNLQLFDLPFTSANVSNTQCPSAIWYSNIAFTAGKQLITYTGPNTTTMTINEIGPTSAAANIAIDTSGDIIVSGHYEV